MNAVDSLAALTLDHLDAVVSVIRRENSAGLIVDRHVIEATLHVGDRNDSDQNERGELVVGWAVLRRDADGGK